MKLFILAGGSGTRLWPLSRNKFPKQFIRLNKRESLLKTTSQRFRPLIGPDSQIVISSPDYKFFIQTELDDCRNILLEPSPKNTAPAIALGVKYCIEKLGCSFDEVIFVSPSDHVIRPIDDFQEAIQQAENVAKHGFIVTFGIKPSRPETGYGYIQCTKKHDNAPCLKVEKFVEKPDQQTAQRYIEEGNFYWNSGMFCFSIKTFLEELSRYAPEICKLFESSFDELNRRFVEMPSISIDYAIMEASKKVVTIPLSLYWNDIGSWDSIFDDLEKDKENNVCEGNILSLNTKNSLIMGEKRFIAAIGLDDCMVIDTADALLIAKRGETQKVREVVENLKKKNAREAEEHLTVFRPWGNYTILEESPRYKIKRIVVNPGEKLSLQLHHHRSEHWVVVKGSAIVTIGDREIFVHESESAFVPKTTRHRLENLGKIPLEIIEVQNGEYLGEDDIVRFEDIYGRKQEV